MIFLGDIAHPYKIPPLWPLEQINPYNKKVVVANLEGALTDYSTPLIGKRKLYNENSVVGAFLEHNLKVVFLANNHITDFGSESALQTKQQLKKRDINPFGAGEDKYSANKPAILNINEKETIFLGFGWKTIQCKPASTSKPGVNPFKPFYVLENIAYWRKKKPLATIVVVLHWNYEMELYPQPADRQLAFDAIDAGANAVIGHHPHRVGGIEMYKESPIAYSLGNWWMPQGVYFGGKLSFDDVSLSQLVLEWEPVSEPICHWFEYSRSTHELQYLYSENCFDSEKIDKLTPFSGMSHEEYKKWFPKNRVKRKALPVYYDYQSTILNSIKDKYIFLRQKGILLLENIGLRKLIKSILTYLNGEKLK